MKENYTNFRPWKTSFLWYISLKKQWLTTFIWSIFLYNLYFWQRQGRMVNTGSSGENFGRCRCFAPLFLEYAFIWSFFWCNTYFWQRWSPKWILFPISVHYMISNILIFGSPNSMGGSDRHMRSPTLLYKIQFQTSFI